MPEHANNNVSPAEDRNLNHQYLVMFVGKSFFYIFEKQEELITTAQSK
jgi:hypothetical protein